ncbi:MAG: hypothetical protein U5R49_24250 [Deltaproteobacteria bacterium]|nr:hypothetical protein [Deltaproteobacteria bacterium]
MKKTIVYIEISGSHKPLLKIVDTDSQVICVLIARDGEHLTVHRQKDSDDLLFTFYSKNKVPSTWDPEKVEIARGLGYKDPERHGQYVIHDSSTFQNGLWIDSYDFSKDDLSLKKVLNPIVGLRIDQNDYLENIPNKYRKLPKIVLQSNEESFWFSIFFTSSLSDFKMTELQPIKSSLGYFTFQISSLDEESLLFKTNQANSAGPKSRAAD